MPPSSDRLVIEPHTEAATTTYETDAHDPDARIKLAEAVAEEWSPAFREWEGFRILELTSQTIRGVHRFHRRSGSAMNHSTRSRQAASTTAMFRRSTARRPYRFLGSPA